MQNAVGARPASGQPPPSQAAELLIDDGYGVKRELRGVIGVDSGTSAIIVAFSICDVSDTG
jgi:hypothetical protein